MRLLRRVIVLLAFVVLDCGSISALQQQSQAAPSGDTGWTASHGNAHVDTPMRASVSHV